MAIPPLEPDRRSPSATSDAAAPDVVPQHRVGGGGCSAAERGASSPVLGPALTRPFRWEVVPDPNPDCAVVGAVGEADTREAADAGLRRALTTYAAGFGFLYEVAEGEDQPSQVRELARIPIRAPDPKPPTW